MRSPCAWAVVLLAALSAQCGRREGDATSDTTGQPKRVCPTAPAAETALGAPPQVPWSVGGSITGAHTAGVTLAAWVNDRGGCVGVSRIDSSGNVLDPTGIDLSCDGAVGGPVLVAANASEFLVVWREQRGRDPDAMRAARVDAAGRVLDPTGIDLTSQSAGGWGLTLASDGRDWMLLEQSDRSRFELRIDAAGRVTGPYELPLPEESRPLETALTFDGQNYVAALVNDVYVGVPGQSEHQLDIERFSPDGSPLLPLDARVATITGQASVQVASDGVVSLVAWRELTADHHAGLHALRVARSGAVLDPAGFTIAERVSQLSSVVGTGAGFLVASTPERDASSDAFPLHHVGDDGSVGPARANGTLAGYTLVSRGRDALAFGSADAVAAFARVDAMGNVLDAQPRPLLQVARAQGFPILLSNGREFLAVWQEWTPDRRSTPMYAQRVSADGAADPDGGVEIASDATHEVGAASNGQDYFVVWSEYRDPSVWMTSHVRGRWIGANGPEALIDLGQGSPTRVICARSYCVVHWMDYADPRCHPGGWCEKYAVVRRDGSFDEHDIGPTGPSTEPYGGVLMAATGAGALLVSRAWHDYSDAEHYEFTALDGNGVLFVPRPPLDVADEHWVQLEPFGDGYLVEGWDGYNAPRTNFVRTLTADGTPDPAGVHPLPAGFDIPFAYDPHSSWVIELRDEWPFPSILGIQLDELGVPLQRTPLTLASGFAVSPSIASTDDAAPLLGFARYVADAPIANMQIRLRRIDPTTVAPGPECDDAGTVITPDATVVVSPDASDASDATTPVDAHDDAVPARDAAPPVDALVPRDAATPVDALAPRDASHDATRVADATPPLSTRDASTDAAPGRTEVFGGCDAAPTRGHSSALTSALLALAALALYRATRRA